MGRGVVVDELTQGCKYTFILIWIISIIVGFVLFFSETIEIGTRTNITTWDLDKISGEKVSYVYSYSKGTIEEGFVEQTRGKKLIESMKEKKDDDIQRQIKQMNLKQSRIDTNTYKLKRTLKGEEEEEVDPNNQFIFYDVEPNITILNQFQSISCRPSVSPDINMPYVDKVSIEGNATFYYIGQPELNSLDHLNKEVKFVTKCSFTGGECSTFNFIHIRNTFESSFMFVFLFSRGPFETMDMESRRGKEAFSLFKISYVTALCVVSVIATFLYLFYYLNKRIFKSDRDHFYVMNLVLLVMLNFYNNPFNIVRYFLNANWISYIEEIAYVLYHVVMIVYICVFIDHFKRLALNKTVGWLTWIMRVFFLTGYTVCYVIYFFMYYLPSSNQPFI